MSEKSFSDYKLQTLLGQQANLWRAGDQIGLARANELLLEEVRFREGSVSNTTQQQENTEAVSLEAAYELQGEALRKHNQPALELANLMIEEALEGRDDPRP